MKEKNVRKTNIKLKKLVEDLKGYSREQNVNIWKEISYRLNSPSKNHAEVNISRLNRHTDSGDIALIPGKVLGAGVLDHPLTIAALGFTELARNKIIAAGGKVLTIEELYKTSPRGSNVKILR